MSYRESFVLDSDPDEEEIENSFNGIPSRSITIEESLTESEDEIIPPARYKKKVGTVLLDDTDSESYETVGSIHKTGKTTKNGVIEDTDSDAEEEFEHTDSKSYETLGSISKTGKTTKNGVIEDTDSDAYTEEEEFEKRAISPRTRMSITGIRPKDLSSGASIFDGESDNITDDDSEPGGNQNSKPTLFEGNKNEVTYRSSNDPDVSKMSLNISNESLSGAENLWMNEDAKSKTNKRFTDMFEQSITSKLSSTTYNPKDMHNSPPKSSDTRMSNSNDSVIIESPQKPMVIELSSGSESSVQMNLIDSPLKKKIQPKIKKALLQTPRQQNQENVYVSKEFFDREAKKLQDLHNEMINSENLLKSLANRLPDNGRQLELRVNDLKADIKKKVLKQSTYIIEENTKLNKSKETMGHPFFPQKVPDWDELSNAVNQIQPKHTGRQGLATFNNEKILTVERLKDIHGSLETCPGLDELSEDPKGLNVDLMPHQKYALTWMGWREKQKPRGGILADDMGLGKTLTMISLILSCKNKSDEAENEEEESESEDESVKANHGWSSKGRREYYNGGTLVVCPASLMRQWEKEAQSRTKRNLLTLCVHHGNNRETKAKHIRKFDMVVTTYNIVSRECKSEGALFGIKWSRIILDEAHIIRNYKSQSSIAVCQLKGKYRWTLTGTPIQNKEMDLYALLKFLKCSPFDELGHWKKWIDNKSAGGQQRLNTLIKSLMLRRTKLQLQEMGELMSLPNKSIELIEVTLDKEEMNVYQKIMIFSRTLFSQYLQQRSDRRNEVDPGVRTYAEQMRDKKGMYYQLHEKVAKMHGAEEIKSHEILTLLLRLRQICCHPGLIDAMLEDENDNSRLESSSDCSHTDVDLLDQLNRMEINDKNFNGSHEKEDSLHESNNALTKASQKVLRKTNPVFNLEQPSSKMKKVLEIIEEKLLCSSDKAIIVSQWTSVLNLLKTHLANRKIPSLSLNGSINVKNRQPIINDFNDPTNRSKVLLLSLTAGGVGLNLVGANHLLLIDLHWNPQLESQAQDRIYRFGQKKNVYIYKFMVKDTVEERIKALQDQKLAIASEVLTGAKNSEAQKLSMDDLKGLFGL